MGLYQVDTFMLIYFINVNISLYVFLFEGGSCYRSTCLTLDSSMKGVSQAWPLTPPSTEY